MIDQRPALRLEQFSVWRGHAHVVRDVSLSVDRGGVLALLGSNGAGKTTLLEGLAGLHRTSGVVSLGPARVTVTSSVSTVRQGISLCPDGRHLFLDMSVSENLALGAYREGRAAGQRRAEAMAASVPWLRDRLRQRAGTLSGGEQQLVAVCRALMAAPRLLLLDSPTSGLGPAFRLQVRDLVRTFVDGGGAVVLADDDQEFVESLASVRVTLSGGRVVESVSAALGESTISGASE